MLYQKSTNLKDLKKENYFKDRLRLNTRNKVINNQPISAETNSEKFSIMQLTEIAQRNQYGVFPSNSASKLDCAMNFLEIIGCSVAEEKRDFSLKNNQTDSTTIENTNIIPSKKELRGQKNKLVTIEGSFPNPADPFAIHDDPPPINIDLQNKNLKQNEKQFSKIKLAYGLSQVNLGRGYGTLKYFK